MEKSEGGDSFPPNKAQSEVVVSSTVATGVDFPAKKLARQLDFTVFGQSPAAAVTAVTEQTQKIQPLTMTSSPQIVPVKLTPVQRPQLQPPPSQPLQHMLLMPMKQTAVPPTHPSIRPPKPESPRARPRQSASEVKDGTPKKQKQCNCKHSRCLKLYCECFASGIYCDGCNCNNCHNNVENEPARREAVEATLERNPHAFRPKIASSPHGARDNKEEIGDGLVLAKHNKGCHCKKSGCLKKYCECFQANILCSENCKCMDCKNFEGSEERQALFHGDHASNIAFLQQAANAAITGAIGSSGYGSPPVNKKRKGQELFFGSTIKDPVHRHGQLQQGNHIKSSVLPSLSSIPGPCVGNASTVGPSKFTYRSLLEDLIQPQDLKELCSVLVVYSGEAAKMLADEKDASQKQAEGQTEASLASSTQERVQNHKDSGSEKDMLDCCSSGDQGEKISMEESSLDGVDISKRRPMSPGTLALMCDESDTMFAAAVTSPNELATLSCNTSSQLPHGQGMTETYAEQERIVLTKFRDCLNRLITLGEIKEKKCSSMVRGTDFIDQKDMIGNGFTTTETRNQHDSFNNGVSNSPLPQPRTTQMFSAVVTTTNNNALPKVHHPDENGDVKPKI
ncbi:protein tesmin/TSO1-like CXC 5 [Solanum dulcamara]|uniref:protein tesmin/TSO1-like CXC 5 n=1 Tax=Solanum dulcamara TaxID=45834 RepID=UPI0024863F0C|nr:protein tesmin/TSO1-like CXC 5 [Solanum dulcamara]